ncbi:hypothetical protein J8273_0131 [Carpediemonas membranifera]|uniref:MSP domain-containing protein n=1 Tax=Carpediemonas membranifera TaxID=201153 RepID=A0A8J6B3H0_9EUKA|nr:hypothetical protein J8273_0131 [Carpediemonas membranifera]|eukprot:KAG9394923.1 hypothetical protein J8273_0131 [Carpediemonas membranifera]
MQTQYVAIQPEKLQFGLPADKEQKRTLSIQNNSDQNVIFKIRTTNPSRFAVKPNSGLILANKAHDISIALQIEPELASSAEDKFQIVVGPVPNEETQANIERYLFTEKDKKALALQLANAWKQIPAPAHQKMKLGVLYAATERPTATASVSLVSLPAPEGNDESDLLRARITVLEKELDDAKRVLNDTTKLDAALQRVDELEKDLDTTRKSANEPGNDRADALQARADELEQELAMERGKVDDAAQYAAAADDSAARIAELEAKLADAVPKAEAEARVAEVEEDNDHLRVTVTQLAEDLSVAKTEVPEEAKEEMARLKAKLSALEQEAEELVAVKENAAIVEQELHEARERLAQQVVDVSTVTELKGKVAALEKELAEAREVTAPVTEVDNSDLEEANLRIADLEKELSKVTQDSEEANRRIAQLDDELENAQQKARELDAAVHRVTDLEKEVEAQSMVAEGHEREVDALVARVAELELEVADSKLVADNTAELEAALQRVSELEAQLADNGSKAETDATEGRIAALERQLADAEKAATGHGEDAKKLEKLKADADQLRGDLKDAKAANKKLNAALEAAKQGAVVPVTEDVWGRKMFTPVHAAGAGLLVMLLIAWSLWH